MEYAPLTPKNEYILRLARGERVHETIQAFCVKEGIATGWFTALGAIEHIELGFYALKEKAYHFKHYEEA
ncbi:MAG: hypothetical protein RI911_928, partial [Candidatus Parcubacteria bacterium]